MAGQNYTITSVFLLSSCVFEMVGRSLNPVVRLEDNEIFIKCIFCVRSQTDGLFKTSAANGPVEHIVKTYFEMFSYSTHAMNISLLLMLYFGNA